MGTPQNSNMICMICSSIEITVVTIDQTLGCDQTNGPHGGTSVSKVVAGPAIGLRP